MKTLLGSLVMLSLGLAACGGQQKDQAAGESEKIAFNDEVKAALASESSSLPAAMIVKVPLGVDGKEDPSLAELRAARVASSNVESTWESAEQAASPSDEDKFVVVNPQEAAASETQAVAALQDRYPYRGVDAARTENDNTNSALTQGNNGLVVTGSNNYTYFNQVNTNSNLNSGRQDLDVNARYYGYNVRPGIYNRGCNGAYWCRDLGWGGYYRHAYRPVYRSSYYGAGGYKGYWGYFSNPYRYVRGNNCYYVYGRPVVYGASVSASSFGWQY